MSETTDATSIFAPLWRRKWLILAVAIIAGLATYFYYKGKTPLYQSGTEIYLAAGTEEQGFGEKVSSKAAAANPVDQVAVVNSIVVEGVRQRLRREGDAAAAQGTVRARIAGEKSAFITISAESHRPRFAALLANSVAQAYIKRQHLSYQRSVLTALSIAHRQLRRIEAAATATAPASKSGSNTKGTAPPTQSTTSLLQAANLNSKINQLESALAVTGAQQIKVAKPGGAVLLSPHPRQNAIFGFLIGLLAAAAAAYVLARFDRRLRSLAAIEAAFGVPILAALPTVRRPIVNREGRPGPSGPLLEPLRRLHANLELLDATRREPNSNGRGRGGADGGVILFTSADAGDGKSTLLADLALVQSDAGVRVAVVEANLRRPVQASLLKAAGPYGLAEVLGGALPVETAMQRVPSGESPAPAGATEPDGSVATMVESGAGGSLSLLAGGEPAANPPALLAGDAMKVLLPRLAGDREYVLVDAPSPLELSDVMPLLPLVDGIVIVARVGHTREPSAQRLVQLLAQAGGAPVIGAVANGVAASDLAKYGFSAPKAARRSRIGR